MLTGFLLPLFLYALLRTSVVQTFLTRQIAGYLSSELNTTIEVGGVDIRWFLKTVITDVQVHDQKGGSLISFNSLSVSVNNISLKRKALDFNSISINQLDLNLIRYKADSSLNLQFLIDYFSSADSIPSETAPWKLQCSKVVLTNSHFLYIDEHHTGSGKGMDYSDLDISGLNLKLSEISFSGDSILTVIDNVSAKEKSGFDLKKLSARAVVCPRGFSTDSLHVITDNSNLQMNLSMYYTDWSAFNDFIDSVSIKAFMQTSVLDMSDIVYFAPDIDGMQEVFTMSGNLSGKVSSFSGKNMSIAFGEGTRFAGTVRMNGLPDITETFAYLKMDEFRLHTSDIGKFTLPYNEGINTIDLPDELVRLGSVIIRGRFTGFYNDFVSNATFLTDMGNIATDILLSNNLQEKVIEYNGHLQAEEFNLGEVFGINELGRVTLDASINGKGLNAEKADFVINGIASQFYLMGNELDQITIDGTYRNRNFIGVVNLSDTLAKLHFNGSIDFSDTIPKFDFQADLMEAKLARLNLWERDASSSLTTHMNLNFKGSTLDNLLGSLMFENTAYSEEGKSLFMNHLGIETHTLDNNRKRMILRSDFADAVFSGQYTFDDLEEYLTFVFTDYFPALSVASPAIPRESKGSFDYTLQLNNTIPVTRIFLPELELDPNTVISGGFDPQAGLVNVNGRSSMVSVNRLKFHDWNLTGSSSEGMLKLDMNCRSLDLLSDGDDTYGIEFLKLTSLSKNDSIRFSLNWNDQDTIDHNRAEIGGIVSFSNYPVLKVGLDAAAVIINDTSWNILPGGIITVDTSALHIENLEFRSSNQSLTLDGSITRDPLDQLNILFNNFNISQLDLLTVAQGIDFDGFLDGTINVSDIYNVPLITSSLVIKRMGFNNEYLGDAQIISSWDNVRKAVTVDSKIAFTGTAGLHYPLFAKGIIYTEKEHDNFDLSIKADNIKLKILQPFFRGLFSRMKGWGSGELTLKGDFSEPVLAGSVRLMRSELLVDYLRTTYSFTGAINFDRNLIWFKDVGLADSIGNTGAVSGKIHHKAFSDWNLDLQLSSNDLFVLNTKFSPDEMYYGQARAKGVMSLSGPIEDLKLKVDATSLKGTQVFIPINYAVDISENDYIFYVRSDTSTGHKADIPPPASNLSLQLGLNVTKDAQIEIILPYRMGNIKVKGDGLVTMGIDTRGDYSMHGQYIMDKGSFLFSLQDLFSRNFEIRKGSKITFNGSPDDADIDLQAIYKIKTNLSGLPSIPAEIASRRIPVDCIVSLSNSLYNPDIHFSIAMPEVDAETQRWVYGAIDTSNTVAMNQQLISLLVLNSFTSTGENAGISTSGLGISSFGIISSQLNNWLSQISKDFDIGINYRPGDQMSAQELELALSTQLFDDRVEIDGAFGMSSANTSGATQNTSQLIGDMNVEVKITEDGRFRVKAFNRTNTSLDLFTGQSPYTQGIGILYRKDFDQFRDLFRRHKTTATQR